MFEIGKIDNTDSRLVRRLEETGSPLIDAATVKPASSRLSQMDTLTN